MRYPLASSSWDEGEFAAIQEVIASKNFTMGQRVREFEGEFARFFGRRYALMANSGSSANLLMIAALRYHSRYRLNPGDEVIVPAVSWSTTYFPVHQYGLHLKFVDVDLETLNVDIEAAREAVGPRTRAVLAVNLLGAPNDFDRLQELCNQHRLVLLEDNCEAMGARFAGRYTGTFGLCSTFSTFFSHHISTMEGGLALTDDEELFQIMMSLRAHGWTRELPQRNYLCDKGPDEWENLFHFVLPGYNLRPLEIQAAVGLRQLEKLPEILRVRRANARLFQSLIGQLSDFSIQRSPGESSWFGFAILLRGALAGHRAGTVERLARAGIESRPIVAGNFCRNPVLRHVSHTICGTLVNADRVDADGFFVGNHPCDLSSELLLLKETLAHHQAVCSAAITP